MLLISHLSNLKKLTNMNITNINIRYTLFISFMCLLITLDLLVKTILYPYICIIEEYHMTNKIILIFFSLIIINQIQSARE